MEAEWAARESWEEAKYRFVTEGDTQGISGALPEADQETLERYAQGLGYAVDMGLSGSAASDAAWRHSVGLDFEQTVQESPTEQPKGFGAGDLLEARLNAQRAAEGVLEGYAEGGLVASNALSDYFRASAGLMTEMEFVGKHKMSTNDFEKKFEDESNVNISGAESLKQVQGMTK